MSKLDKCANESCAFATIQKNIFVRPDVVPRSGAARQDLRSTAKSLLPCATESVTSSSPKGVMRRRATSQSDSVILRHPINQGPGARQETGPFQMNDQRIYFVRKWVRCVMQNLAASRVRPGNKPCPIGSLTETSIGTSPQARLHRAADGAIASHGSTATVDQSTKAVSPEYVGRRTIPIGSQCRTPRFFIRDTDLPGGPMTGVR